MGSDMAFVGWLTTVAALVVGGAAAATYTVGDSLGWTVPPGGSNEYSEWAQGRHFHVGDIVVFNWNGTHTVAEVSQPDYESCITTNSIGMVRTTSPVSISLYSNATRYFICTIGSHCSLGQKVAIATESSASSLATSALSALLFATATAISFFTHV